jgi:hypothetical protein
MDRRHAPGKRQKVHRQEGNGNITMETLISPTTFHLVVLTLWRPGHKSGVCFIFFLVMSLLRWIKGGGLTAGKHCLREMTMINNECKNWLIGFPIFGTSLSNYRPNNIVLLLQCSVHSLGLVRQKITAIGPIIKAVGKRAFYFGEYIRFNNFSWPAMFGTYNCGELLLPWYCRSHHGIAPQFSRSIAGWLQPRQNCS